MTNSSEGLQPLLQHITNEGDAFCLEINTTKTKVMVFIRIPGAKTNLNINGKETEYVSKYRYLEYWLTSDLIQILKYDDESN